MLRPTVGFYSDRKPRSRNCPSRTTVLDWYRLNNGAPRSSIPTQILEVPLMPIVRHDLNGKVTRYSSTTGYGVQDVIHQCLHDELDADLARRRTPYEEFLAKLREGDTHDTGD